METRCGCAVRVEEETQVGEARRQIARLATDLGFDETDAGRVALVATEMAGNLVKHAPGGGRLLAQPRPFDGAVALDILSLDQGRGIGNVPQALRDGFTTAGSPGTGLGAISRLADLFDINSVPGVGTAVLARVWPRGAEPPPQRLQFGAVHMAKPKELVCGDAWAMHPRPDGALLLVVDGLGHGPGASEAAGAAVRAFRGMANRSPTEILELLHAELRGSRGAAAAVAVLDAERGEVRFAGLGNIAGTVAGADGERSMVSHNGIVGHQLGKLQEFSYPWGDDSVVVLHSDGVQARWSMSRYPGLTARDPALQAGVLYRDYCRETDDATVVVARRSPPR
ncbi:MAG TPA: ATP-binding SpoIIE family protein phosphatase [Longimicrobium sp.]|nr:ATP-binding SpoIIE family protein phosphatase [Longimicrobium sp.]